ncbi:MAG: L,D-transpeptidase [Elusimicrobia bacterium]|nr:L,D-transpeptidase [Elusimicrobiota bacterium]
MKILKKIINIIFGLAIAIVVVMAVIDIYNFLSIRNEYNPVKRQIYYISKDIKQIEKERNKIYKQSNILKSRQLLLIENNKNLIEKSIYYSNENLLTSGRINEIINSKDIYILVDTKENVLYVKQKGQIIKEAKCSVGKGGTIVDKKTGRKWEFITPRGVFVIKSKIENPIWVKPDWAFLEDKKDIPLLNAPERRVEGELGKYAMDLGFGYKIHGTQKEEFLGRAVSHGCIRLGAVDLEYIYNIVKINKTVVYIY